MWKVINFIASLDYLLINQLQHSIAKIYYFVKFILNHFKRLDIFFLLLYNFNV